MIPTPEPDAFARFARAHLPTPAERAVYPVLAGVSDGRWTAGEVAAAAGVSHHEADQALRRFAAAGIVDRIRVRGRSDHYRWHPEMSYLREGHNGDLPIDPVCGMPVPPDTAHVAADHDGASFSFCSLPCLVRWRSERRRGR